MPLPKGRVVLWETSDGVRHPSKTEMLQHQLKIDTAAQLQNNLFVSLSTMRPASIVAQIMENVDSLLPILAAYKKKAKKGLDNGN